MALRGAVASDEVAPIEDTSAFVRLLIGSLIPLHVVLAGLTWILHDYFVTLEDEIRYIWPQRSSFSKLIIALLLFDVVQIHVFARPGITSNNLCVAMDTIIRVVGALSLWSLRVYAIYGCSKRVAAINTLLFAGSIAGFLWILVHNNVRRAAVIASAIHLPLPGCPSVHSGIEWSQWVPATAYEGVLFGFALYRTCESAVIARRTGFGGGTGPGLYALLLRDNVLYFLGCSITHIPWFSYAPFHAAVGIMTTRMLISLRKAVDEPASFASTSFTSTSNSSFNSADEVAFRGVALKPKANTSYRSDATRTSTSTSTSAATLVGAERTVPMQFARAPAPVSEWMV
ncbi:hypothetical protein B0H15DRAFT_925669 [Mycena belliarum]|uniref:DUF6533 domain-containing protein n=1 Tax=Mycena belliarum TaxID=1033014 RepID=A0AAD6XIK6_9AGAR|nr:hypothetical protein B0H15DRAFT_925669 [Mycena belliae]